MEKMLPEVEVLRHTELDQLAVLENSYLAEIGEQPLTDDKWERLQWAISEERITFFVAKNEQHIVGMCSVSRCFSTFACADIGVFEDFYIEPDFRRKGVARRLAMAAQQWCRAQGIASLAVTCAPCDEALYRALGFDVRLGTQYAHIIQ